MIDQPPREQFDIVPWNPSFETGIAIIDEQHTQLVRLLNELAYGYVCGVGHSEIEPILNALIEYAAYHFEMEEALWAELQVNEKMLEGHLKTHQSFVETVRAMQSRLNTDDHSTVISDLLSFLISWLAHHILYEDKRLALVLLHVRAGMALDAANQQAHAAMSGQTSVLIQIVLSMYKELSSRTLDLEREAYARQVAEKALAAQEQHWGSVLAVSSDSLWDWEFSKDDAVQSDQLVTTEHFAKNDFCVHPDDWPSLRQDFLAHMMGQSEVFLHQHRIIDAAGNERWIQSRGKIIEQDSAGHAKRMVGTQTDITERKTAELTLQRERDTRTLISEFATDFMVSSAEDFDAAVHRALQRSCEYMHADRAYVFLLSADGCYVNNTHEWCDVGIKHEIKNLQSIPTTILSWWFGQFRDKGYVFLPRVSDMPPEAHNEYLILELQNVRSLYASPLYVDKKLIGFMGCDAVDEEREWSAESIEFLNVMGDLLGIALGHRQILEKRAQATRQLERAEQLAQLGHWQADYASNQIAWSQEVFRIYERDAQTFVPSIDAYFELMHPDDREAMFASYEAAKSSLNELHLEHRIVLADERVKHLEVKGRFEANAAGDPTIAEGTVQDVTEKVQHRESLQRLAFEDSLTGLPNRRSIESTLTDEMTYCVRHDRGLVLALLDLDNFSEINDLHGPAVGDALLKALAQRIRRLLSSTAIIARVGGDEFVVLFTRLQTQDSYFQQLSRLLAVISQPLTIDGVDIVLTASIGVTEFPQPMQVAAEQLIRQAQQALFQAKIMGKGLFQRYDVNFEQDARALTDYIDQIRRALHAGEFVLHYQPKVCMKTGAVFGAEALVRWQKSTGELVPPNDFLPALYNHPLEVELGDWVIRAALAQMRTWKQQGMELQVSVNVSSLQLFDDAFVEKLSKDLEEYSDILPSAFQLEVLESSMLDDLDAVSGIMQRSRQLGISFALDDFGTGYSSLAYLKHLPASVLKIDQSFVREMMESSDDLSIISGVIGMANAFGMRVIAEGVESIEQGNLLLRLGCQQAQGYGIARPMPAAEFPAWLQSWKAEPSWLGLQPVEVQNLPLLYAEVEHRYWITALEKCLAGEGEVIPALDAHLCKVGVWTESEAHSRLGLHEKFSHMVNLHHDLHTIGQNAISMHAKGDVSAALKLLPQIRQQCDLFLTELRRLIS